MMDMPLADIIKALIGWGGPGIAILVLGFVIWKLYVRNLQLSDANNAMHEEYAAKTIERIERLATIIAANTQSNEVVAKSYDAVARSHDASAQAFDRLVRVIDGLGLHARGRVQ